MARLSRIGCCLALAAVLSGCAAARLPEVSWQDPGVDLVWPKPPETPRIRFLRTIEPDDFVEQGRGRQLFRWISGEKEQVFPLVTPYGVAADGRGMVWVADRGLRAVHAFNLVRQRVDYIAAVGGEPLSSPVDVAVDVEAGRLYISDSALQKVFAVDYRGNLLGVREAPGGFGRPGGLACDAQGNLYAVDVLKGTVEMFTRDGTHLKTLRSAVDPKKGFNGPTNVAVDTAGRIFVGDSMNFRVEVFGPQGESLGTIGDIGDVPGTFARPRGVAVDSQSHVYVADAAFDNIQVFDLQGNLLLYFGEGGEGKGEFSLPAGLFFDHDDRLYVVDAHNHRIQVYQYLRLN